jgi:hypothetical protein
MNAQREKMQSLVSRWKDSGLSQAEFARKNELKLHMFRYWILKLRKEEDDSPAFIALDGFATVQISLHYPNGVELILPAQTPVCVLKSLIHFDTRCSR